MSDPTDGISQPERQFRTTRWSLVVSAAAESDAALEELCQAYWPPLFWHLRRVGYEPAQAEDLTQAFFTRLLDKRLLEHADPNRGRFRTFLLTALRRFVVNEGKYQRAVKRGGGTRHLSLDWSDAGHDVIRHELAHDLTPDRLFDRHWALVVLQRAYHQLETEQRTAGKEASFKALAPCLAFDRKVPGYDTLAETLNSTPAALRMAVSRLRARLRELVRAEIQQTVGDERDVEDEIRELFRALRT